MRELCHGGMVLTNAASLRPEVEFVYIYFANWVKAVVPFETIVPIAPAHRGRRVPCHLAPIKQSHEKTIKNALALQLLLSLPTSVLEAPLGLYIFEESGKLFVVEPALEAWNELLGLLRVFWTEIGDRGQFEFMQLFVRGEDLPDGSDVFHILELGKALGVIQGLHEHFGELLLLLGRLVLCLSVLQQDLHLGNEQRLRILIFELLGKVELGGILFDGRRSRRTLKIAS